jgi:hypothetical protein
MVVGMLLFISTLLGLISGHMMLLARFPPFEERIQKRFFASGSMRGVTYNNALRVALGSRGLHLAPAWPFRPISHPGIPCIPWRELRCTRSQEERAGWFSRGSRFEIPRVGLRFQLAGKAGRAVETALKSAGVSPSL